MVLLLHCLCFVRLAANAENIRTKDIRTKDITLSMTGFNAFALSDRVFEIGIKSATVFVAF